MNYKFQNKIKLVKYQVTVNQKVHDNWINISAVERAFKREKQN